MTSQLSALAGGLSFKKAKSYYSLLNLFNLKYFQVDPKKVVYRTLTKNELKLKYFLVHPLSEADVCPRCTRTHPGGPNTCKSIDKMCRQCGVVGHYVEVHAVTDFNLRQQIIATLGFDIYSNVAGCEPEPVFIPSVIVPALPQPVAVEWPAPGMDDWYST